MKGPLCNCQHLGISDSVKVCDRPELLDLMILSLIVQLKFYFVLVSVGQVPVDSNKLYHCPISHIEYGCTVEGKDILGTLKLFEECQTWKQKLHSYLRPYHVKSISRNLDTRNISRMFQILIEVTCWLNSTEVQHFLNIFLKSLVRSQLKNRDTWRVGKEVQFIVRVNDVPQVL